MKTSIKQSLKSGTKGWMPALLVTAALMLSGAPSLRADDDDHHHSDRRHDSDDGTFGSKTLLSVFQDTYWRQFYAEFTLIGKVTLPADQNGHPVLRGIALMPLPDASGDGTPASIDVTLKNGQRFFLPLWGSWAPATPMGLLRPIPSTM